MPSRLLIVSFSVCPAPDRHGVALLNVLKALAPRYACDVLTLRHGELPFVERFMKTRMLRVPVGHGALSEQVEAFRRAIRRQLEGEEYDVIHLRSAWGGRAVLAGVTAQSSGTRVVYEVARSTEAEPRAADAQLAAALAAEEAECALKADLVLVPTESARAHLAARGLGDKVVVVPPGVDVDHFDWEPGGAGDRVLYAGHLAAGRGVRLMVEAVGSVLRRRPIKLVLAGPVEEAFGPLLEAALATAGLGPDDVEQLGPIDHDDIPRLIAQATVCLAPASPDSVERPLAGFPGKILEYMACRRAVVAPRRSSVEEVIADGRDGLLFAPGDAADLSRAIGRLLDDKQLRESIAESGYHRVRRDHAASATRRRLLEAHARLVPASEWAPPGKAPTPIDGLPSHPDTTTARRSMLGMAQGELSGEIVISGSGLIALPVEPGVVVIEALDFASAGEPYEATVEPDPVREPNAPIPEPVPEPIPDAAEPDADEKTRPGPLRPKRPSG